MNALKIKKYLYHQTPLEILSFISNYPEIPFSANEVSKTGIPPFYNKIK